LPADTIVGYLIIGAGILFVLGLVFAITSRQTAPGDRPRPPRGVHLPNPSLLPFIFSVGAALLGAGLALHSLNVVLYAVAAVGVLVIVYAAIGWVRAAGREWHETERTPHDEAAGH
jgi:threonine/homoserine/homoserine lactone efflux protein